MSKKVNRFVLLPSKTLVMFERATTRDGALQGTVTATATRRDGSTVRWSRSAQPGSPTINAVMRGATRLPATSPVWALRHITSALIQEMIHVGECDLGGVYLLAEMISYEADSWLPEDVIEFVITLLHRVGNYPLANLITKANKELACPGCGLSTTTAYNRDHEIRDPNYRYCFECGHEWTIS
jgi:hypothetical protein